MAVIYLAHPLHGTKVACEEEEAKYDEKNGWKRYDIAASATVIDEGEVNDLRKQYEAKFGKAPHHKKSAETLKKELEAA